MPVTVDTVEREAILANLRQQAEAIRQWPADPPNPDALRCEHSRHRTLGHLRACQEQWLTILISFAERPSPSVKILHPWRQFEVLNYALLDWDDHMEQFRTDRRRWLSLCESVDWERKGKWNAKPDSIAGLTKRLVKHEAFHIDSIRSWNE